MKKITQSFFLLLFLLFSCHTISVKAQVAENHSSKVARNLEIFNDIYKMLDIFYVDTLAADTVMQWAINGMLAKVDPYTGYYPADDDDLRQMATGKYAGIGSIIRYHKKHDRVIIAEPYEKTPSYNAGLRAGDIILTVDGKDIKGMMPAKVTEMLRGEAGTTLELKFQRPGEKKPRVVSITRSTIQLPSIPYYGILDEGIGYLNLSSFTAGCAREMRHALMQLISDGAKSLVLDLRDNGGGSINEAVDILNLFLPKGEKVLFTKGKMASMNHEYFTTTDPIAPDMPVVVLVNGMSASSSEIVCGALQDLDRAVVMGNRTYGKGLVQSIRDLPYRGELKITTGRYYIPSGRCIQAHQYNHDGSSKAIPDSLRSVFYTKAGRRVTDGGGIDPDYVMQNDTMPTMVYDLVQSDVFFDWVTQFALSHDEIEAPGTFRVSDSLYADFSRYIEESDFTYNRRSDEIINLLRRVAQMEGYLEDAEAEMKALELKFAPNLKKDLERMKSLVLPYLENDIVLRYYHQKGSIRHALPRDKAYLKAVDLLRNAEDYRAILEVKDK